MTIVNAGNDVGMDNIMGRVRIYFGNVPKVVVGNSPARNSHVGRKTIWISGVIILLYFPIAT